MAIDNLEDKKANGVFLVFDVQNGESAVKSLIFKKEVFSEEKAEAWAKENGFEKDTIQETETEFRINAKFKAKNPKSINSTSREEEESMTETDESRVKFSEKNFDIDCPHCKAKFSLKFAQKTEEQTEEFSEETETESVEDTTEETTEETETSEETQEEESEETAEEESTEDTTEEETTEDTSAELGEESTEEETEEEEETAEEEESTEETAEEETHEEETTETSEAEFSEKDKEIEELKAALQAKNEEVEKAQEAARESKIDTILKTESKFSKKKIPSTRKVELEGMTFGELEEILEGLQKKPKGTSGATTEFGGKSSILSKYNKLAKIK